MALRSCNTSCVELYVQRNCRFLGLAFSNLKSTLYVFSLHGYAKMLTADIPGAFLSVDWPVDAKVKMNAILDNGAKDFYQAKE